MSLTKLWRWAEKKVYNEGHLTRDSSTENGWFLSEENRRVVLEALENAELVFESQGLPQQDCITKAIALLGEGK